MQLRSQHRNVPNFLILNFQLIMFYIFFQSRYADERLAAAGRDVGRGAGVLAEPALRLGGRHGQGGTKLLCQVSGDGTM